MKEVEIKTPNLAPKSLKSLRWKVFKETGFNFDFVYFQKHLE